MSSRPDQGLEKKGQEAEHQLLQIPRGFPSWGVTRGPCSSPAFPRLTASSSPLPFHFRHPELLFPVQPGGLQPLPTG
jgi:hypothetical protein